MAPTSAQDDENVTQRLQEMSIEDSPKPGSSPVRSNYTKKPQFNHDHNYNHVDTDKIEIFCRTPQKHTLDYTPESPDFYPDVFLISEYNDKDNKVNVKCPAHRFVLCKWDHFKKLVATAKDDVIVIRGLRANLIGNLLEILYSSSTKVDPGDVGHFTGELHNLAPRIKIFCENFSGSGSETSSEGEIPPSPKKQASVDETLDYNIDPYVAPKKNIVDTHCHLDRLLGTRNLQPSAFTNFMKRSPANFGPKFEGCIAVFCDPHNWDLDLIKKFLDSEPNVWATFGCHPKNAPAFKDSHVELLKKALGCHPRVVALGEIGMDKSVRDPDANCNLLSYKKQVGVFHRQLNLAVRLNLPICLHIRLADNVSMEIMETARVPSHWKIHYHCVSEGMSYVNRWIDKFPGMKFGMIAGKTPKSVMKEIPLNKILLETDAPYFSPKMFMGFSGDINDPKPIPKRWVSSSSHPGFVFHAASQVAQIRGMPVGEVLAAARENAKEIYGI